MKADLCLVLGQHWCVRNMLKLTGVHWSQIIFPAQSLNADRAFKCCASTVGKSSGTVTGCFSPWFWGNLFWFLPCCDLKNSSGQIKMCFSAVMKKMSIIWQDRWLTQFLLSMNAVVDPWHTSAQIYITPRAHCYPALGCVSPTSFLACAVNEAWSKGCSHFPFPHYCYLPP